MIWPAPIAEYWADPWQHLAQCIPAPRVSQQRGPPPDPESRRTQRLAKERERMRKKRARAKA